MSEIDIAYGYFPESVSDNSWSEFNDELSYTLNDEWYLYYKSHKYNDDIELYPGENVIEGIPDQNLQLQSAI